jgi:hypothetical protein
MHVGPHRTGRLGTCAQEGDGDEVAARSAQEGVEDAVAAIAGSWTSIRATPPPAGAITPRSRSERTEEPSADTLSHSPCRGLELPKLDPCVGCEGEGRGGPRGEERREVVCGEALREEERAPAVREREGEGSRGRREEHRWEWRRETAAVGFGVFIPQLEKSEVLVPSDGYEVTCLNGLDQKNGRPRKWVST